MPWFDELELYPGENISSEIETAMKYTSSFAIFISKKSLEGEDSIQESGWVQTELKKALTLEKNSLYFCIPVFLGELDLEELSKNEHIPKEWFNNQLNKFDKLGIGPIKIDHNSAEAIAKKI